MTIVLRRSVVHYKRITIVSLLLGAAVAAPSLKNAQKLKRTPTGSAVENSYIVVLKENASRAASLQALDELVVPLSDVKEVVNNQWTVLNGYSAKLSGAALQHVLNDAAVDYVEENAIVTINWQQADTVEAREPMDVVPATVLSKRQTGAGVDVYSLDTGVRITHQSFTGRARWGAVFTGTQQDGNGHGTHTASTAAGQGFGPATAADVIAVKVLSDSGSGTWEGVISGIDFVTTSAVASGKPSVANMSLGGGIQTSVDTAVRNSIAAGVHYTLSAGNSNIDTANQSPARVEEAVTVGALTSAKAKASFSNFGALVDVWYLGVSVTAAWSTSDTATNTISGTSMAAPGVAGLLAAAISANGNTTPAALRDALVAAAVADATGIPSGTTTLRAVPF